MQFRYPKFRGHLFTKYVALFAAVVCVALLTSGLSEIWFFYHDHKASLIRIQREQAKGASAKIGQFLEEIQAQLGWTTQLPWTEATLEQRRIDLMRLLRQVPAITELVQVDPAGIERLRVSRLQTNTIDTQVDRSNDPRFVHAVTYGKYYGNVYFRRESEPYMTLALSPRRDSGVTIAEVNLKFIKDVLAQIKVSEHGHAYVLDADNRLIAHPDINLVLRGSNLSNLPQVKTARGATGDAPEELQAAEDANGTPVLTAYAQVPPIDWAVFVEMPRAEAYTRLYDTLQRTGLLLLAALGMAVIAGLFLARQMVVPIKTLQAGAARIGRGDLSQRISVTTGDELEGLADQFNEMAEKLQHSYADLENKVATRTHELARSVSELRALGDVSQAVNSTLDLESVLTTIVSKAVQLSGTEAGSIYVFDNSAQIFVLRATHGMDETAVGQFREQNLDLATPYIATAIERNEPIQIPDILQEPPTPVRSLLVRAGYQAILAAPLMRPDEVVGLLVVRRRGAGPFSDGIVDLMKTFSAQSVLAIQNARLFNEINSKSRQLEAESKHKSQFVAN